MTLIPKLIIGSQGRLRGNANITWNDQFPWNDSWPSVNGTPGGFGTPFGGVIHTEVGFEHFVVQEFNTPSAKASAFFSIGMDGHIHQYGPLGQDWEAWTQEAGNHNWRGVEHEDKGNPDNPMPMAQLIASAQVFEAMSTFDGLLGNPWPLKATDDVNGRGIILHVDGGVAWGNHACPGKVRSAQRPKIIQLANQIRSQSAVVVADGVTTFGAMAGANNTQPAAMLRVTAEQNKNGYFPNDVAQWVNTTLDKTVPAKGLRFLVPSN